VWTRKKVEARVGGGKRLAADAAFVKARTGFSIGVAVKSLCSMPGRCQSRSIRSLFRFDELWRPSAIVVFRLSPAQLEPNASYCILT
jgi:hypothetical protein